MSSLAKKNTETILRGNLFAAILALAIPLIANNFIQTLYNLTDTYWLGKLGTNEVAAISLITPLQNIIINFGMGIMTAGAILISRYVGANDSEKAKKMVSQLFVCALLLAIVCGSICFIFTPAISKWLKADGEVYRQSIIYMRIVLCDMPFLFTINVYSAVSQANGDTISPMKLNLLGVIINIFLDPLLMLVFKWGIAGAALATVFAKVPCAAIAVILMTSKKRDINLSLKHFKFDYPMLKSIITVGLPTAIGGSTMQFGFLLMTKNVLVYGANAMAAYGIGNKLNSIITMPSNAIGSATTTIVSQNIGAKQIERAESGYKKARMMAVIFLFSAGMILSRPYISTAMADIFSNDPKVIAMAADFLSIMAFWCFTNGIYNTTVGLFNGAANTIVTMAVDAARLWIFRFATLFIFSHYFHMAERSVWYSVAASNAIAAAVLWILYKMKLWKAKIKNDI